MSAVEIHPTALVDPSCRIGEGTRVGPFAVIEAGVSVGGNCRIYAHAVIRTGTRLGEGNQVHEHAVLGGPPQDLKHRGGESGVRIGDRNVFREGVTVNRSTAEGAETVIGDDCYLMTQSHVAHECVLEDRVILANNVALAGHVSLGERVFLSGGVVVHQFSKVGRLAMVGGNGKVTQDVLPFSLADGVPARTRGLNLVGLRRAGFTPDQTRELKQAFRILQSPGVLLKDRLDELAALGSPLADQLREFIAGSQRGFSPFL